ncbi:hypothetical protein Tco_1128758 [Tanacetum coccineum]
MYKTEHEMGKSDQVSKPKTFPFQKDQPEPNLMGRFPVNYPPQETNKEILQAREDLMETIQAFLKEYDHIPPNKKCMALLLAEERFLKIKQTMEEKQNQPEVMQELLLKLMNDLQILKGNQQEKKEPAAQSFTPYWNFSMIDDEEARENFMKDICTFLRKFSRISFRVMPKVLSIAWERFGEIKDALTDEQYQQEDIQELMSKLLEDILSDSNDDGISSDDDDFEDIKYISLEEVNNVDQEEKEFDLEDILQIQDVILREKLLNISRLITNIESLNENPTPDHVFKSPSSFPILVTDIDSFFEKSDTSLSYSDNSLPEFEPFSDDTKEMRSGSTTTHANNSLPEYDSFLFEIEPDQGELTNVVIEEVDTFFVLEDSIPPGIESNFDPGGGEIDFSQNVEDDDSFTFVIWTFLPYHTYPVDSPLLLSTGSEDTIFDPGIST